MDKVIEITTLPGCVGIRVGTELEIKATVTWEIEDHSFDHEYGTEVRTSVEIDEVSIDHLRLHFPSTSGWVELKPDELGVETIEEIKATVCRDADTQNMWPDESDFREEYELQKAEAMLDR